jgi:hypothetical protein
MENLPALIFALPILLIGVGLAVQPLFNNDGYSFGPKPSSLAESLRLRAELLQERTALYNALIELDFDYTVDKIAEADYARQRYALMAQAVRVLRQLDALAADADPVEAALRAHQTEQTLQAADDGCIECGFVGKPHDRFCRGCGAPLQVAPQEVAHATR